MNALVPDPVCVPQQFSIDWLLEYYGLLIEGFGTTMGLYATGLVIGFVLGLGLAVCRQYGGPVISRLATAYIEVMRGTPMLIQLYIFYFFAPFLNAVLAPAGPALFDLRWTLSFGGVTFLNHPVFVGMVTLGLNSAAYQAEYLRGGMASISGGQLLAARSMGMTMAGGIRHIIIPQSLRRAIPAWSNEAAYLPKYTVIVSFVGVNDLFQNAARIVGSTFIVLPVWLTVAAIFIVVISLVSKSLDYVYAKTRIPM